MSRPLCLLAALLFAAPALRAEAPFPPKGAPVRSARGMVVCVSPPAADVGADILRRGGSAVDAAVAVGFALAVTWPEAGNVGGGGFMLVAPGAGREPTMFDYRETAPALATADMFAQDANPLTHRAAGVPGSVRGFELAHKRFGKLPWIELVAPAVALAEKGFVVNGPLAKALNKVLADPKTTNAEFRRVYGKSDGTPWADGDRLTLPDLGKTLRGVMERGPESFYTGESARLLEQEMLAGGGLIRAGDLAAYRAKERPPVRGTYRGYEVVGASPPSGGGTILVEMLNILETFDLAEFPRYSPRTVHRLAEAQRRAFADRAQYLGDPDFGPIPAKLLTKEYARELAKTIRPEHATPSAEVAPDLPLSDAAADTTHYGVVDKNGMAVSNTTTLENAFGNRVVVKGAGYILNNEMTDFNHRPGWTDAQGNVGTKPNEVAPGKRMLSSMCPTILLKDGKPALVTGSPGGRTIPNTVLSIVVGFVDYKMTVQEAVDSPRQHHQWFPDRLTHEEFPGFPALAEELKAMGHAVRKGGQGDGHSIAIDPKTGERVGAADKRLDGKAAGE